ncbi:MAG: hypothetical protein HQL53_12350, partial [Magnetococcales bacterium]|nr:hypothetical protein [Magnetococcales bacterium]
RRAAPVQATWLGYPDTSGLDEMDYRITDPIADPPGKGDQYATEKMARLPNGFHCYRPPRNAPEPNSPPSLQTERITFTSFNNIAKVTPDVVQVWSRILCALPSSRFLMKHRSLTCPDTRSRYQKMFQNHGVDPARLEMVPWSPTVTDHLNKYNETDIALDPFPYNGVTTSCEAMWMGVPVVTLRGKRHVARVGASLLTRLGLTSLICENEDHYVQEALALASDPELLATLRGELRHRMTESPLCNGPAFAADFQQALREMWQAFTKEE